ncbi:SIR2 family protein [Fodinibius halophilus]|uniref:SIR2-like domain-containing protein n=1 Tax=Fodinibius halophilus TaxID=1736908 RepID=A0A6M1T2P9_9BACT|nr:hypothetical protein [Fodinibius halophilus]NGP88309.1 hypothetical protein [Fodinibius halophilus]
MQNQAVILNVMKDLPFNGSRWILEILRQAQNDEIKGFAKPSSNHYESWKWTDWLNSHINSIGAVISFNYDLVVEKLFKEFGVKLTPHEMNNESGDIFFTKPHGSINYEVNSSHVNVPKNQYPLTIKIAGIDTPNIEIISDDQLHEPRKTSFLVLPNEYRKKLQWVENAYKHFSLIAQSYSHILFVGLSYWPKDRPEINKIVKGTSKKSTIIEVNTSPQEGFKEYVTELNRAYEFWKSDPEIRA